jgi:polysaccharide biosynthesis/export protein
MRAPYVVTSLMAIALAACSAHSTGAPGEIPLVRDGGAMPSGPSTRGDRAAEAGPPRNAGSGSSSALNLRLMEQAAKSGDTGDLPVGTGDLLEISVFEVEELSKIRVRVPGRGVISLPLVGQIEAAGHTTAELEDEIRARLQKKFMHEPQVSVFLQEQQSQRISVMGAVRKGGVFSITRPLRLADALAMAEGLTDEADRDVYVIRRAPASAVSAAAARSGATGVTAATAGGGAGGNGTVEVMAPIDLTELADGREDLNVPLQAGDVVNVPRAGSVYVGGSVERPGSFLLRGKTTAQQAIFAAGGVKDVADWSDVRLYRKSPSGKVEVTTYDLEAFEKGAAAPELQRNDVLVVGKHAGKAFLYGFLDFFKGALGVAKGI